MAIRDVAALSPIPPPIPRPGSIDLTTRPWANALVEALNKSLGELYKTVSLLSNQDDVVNGGVGPVGPIGPTGPPGPITTTVIPHAPTHLPSGTDPLATAIPILVGLSPLAIGSAEAFARSDHVHKIDQGIAPVWTSIHTFNAQDVHNAGISLGTSGVINSAEPDGGGQPSFLLQPSVSHTTDSLLQLKDFAGNVKLEYLAGGEMGVQGTPTAGELLSFSTSTTLLSTLRMGIRAYIQLNGGSPTAFSAISGTANIGANAPTPSGAPSGMVGHVAVQALNATGNANLSAFMSAGVWGGANITSAANAPSPANVALNMRGNLARVSSVHGAFFAPSTASGGTNRPWVSAGLTGDIPAYTHQSGSQAGLDIISTSSSTMVGSNASDAIQAFGGRLAFPTGRITGTQRKAHLTFHHRGTGIGTITSAGTALTGVGTQFTTQLIVGSTITIPNAAGSATARTATVASITNNTAAVLNAGFTGSDATLATPFEYTYAAIGAGGPSGNAVGDLYFDLGTNNPIGLAEYDTAWRYLLHPASVCTLAGAGNWGPITGQWKFNAMDDVASNVAATTWLFTSNRSDAGTPPNAFTYKAASSSIADHTDWTDFSGIKILGLTSIGDLASGTQTTPWVFTSNRSDAVGFPDAYQFKASSANITDHTEWINNVPTTVMRLTRLGNLTITGNFNAVNSTLSGSLVATGGATLNGGLTMPDASSMVLGTNGGGGVRIGTNVLQQIGLWNTAPIAQPAGALQVALTDSTGGSSGTSLAACASVGVDLVLSASQTDVNARMVTINNNISRLFGLLDAMRTAMVNFGSMKGAA